MNRPMAVIGFSLFFTLIAVGLLGYIVAFYVFIVLAAVFLVAVLTFRRRLPTAFLAAMLSSIIACAFFCTYTNLVYNRVISFAGKSLGVTLEITDIEGENYGTYYYEARIVKSEYRAIRGAKVRVSTSAPLEVGICDLVSADVTFNIAGANLASSQLYYKSSGIFLKTHILDGYEIEKNPDKSLGFYFYSIKQAISEIVCANLPEDSAGVVNSIFLGDKNGLDYKDNVNFRFIGVSHIFCVSGLHVTLISAFIYKILSALIERKRILYAVTIFAVWFFVAITGFSYSSIRSGIMLSVYYLGCMLGRQSNSINSLGFAALVVCLLNPFSATNISFLYSFFATLGMLVMPKPKFMGRVRVKALRSVIETAVMSVGVAVFTLPIQIFFFGTATLISPLSNCLIFFVIPLLMSCTIIAVVLSLFTSVLSSLFFLVCSVIAKYLLFVSDAIVKLPYTTLDASMGFVKYFVIIVVVGLLVIVYLRLGRKAIKTFSVVCAVMLLTGVLCYNVLFRPVMTAQVIDSGAATSVVVTQGRNAVVVGCGGKAYTAVEISNYLGQKTIGEIDLLILPSHNTSDVVKLDRLVEMVDIDRTICGEDYGLAYSLGLKNFSVSNEGKCNIGDMTVNYSYTDEHRLTYIEMGDFSLLVVSMITAESEFDKKWKNADAVISVGGYYSTNNEKINVLCTDKNGNYPVTQVCYKDGGNIEIDFLKNGLINCERRA